MGTQVDPRAGQPAQPQDLIDIKRLVDAYYSVKPDWEQPAQRVAFGTSGHRGSSMSGSFNENHILAVTQAVCDYRKTAKIDGPLFVGIDTHALSRPAFDSALEVLAGNGAETLIARNGEFTPTPVVSHAILVHNRGRATGLADGIVITPSHNPPEDGGFKYNPPNGGPAETGVTGWIQDRANALLQSGLKDVKRLTLHQARRCQSIRDHDFIDAYVSDLDNVLDFDVVRGAGVRIGVDPLGGAGVHYWARIADQYRIDLDVVSDQVDPTFGFMTLDWDGRIRMDPSSTNAMQRLIGMKDRYDIAFACDTDHDRHGIVVPGAGLLSPNHYLSVAINYLFQHRLRWASGAAVGKTVVSSAMIDRVTSRLRRTLYEVPVGFKWFAEGLFEGTLGLGCEESAGASFLRRDGTVWTTDKDGMTMALLSAEITAREGHDPGELYRELTSEFGEIFADRIEHTADASQKARLSRLSPEHVTATELAGESIERILDTAPGNDEPIGGIKVVSAGGWFAARPSGTEDIYKIYAESFRGHHHLQRILEEAQTIVDSALETSQSVRLDVVSPRPAAAPKS